MAVDLRTMMKMTILPFCHRIFTSLTVLSLTGKTILLIGMTVLMGTRCGKLGMGDQDTGKMRDHEGWFLKISDIWTMNRYMAKIE